MCIRPALQRGKWKFYKPTDRINSVCGKTGICIDDTQGYDGTRIYNGYAPTLRANRSGLKVVATSNICINDRGFVEKSPQVTVGYSPTLRAESHGNLPKVVCCSAIRGRYEEDGSIKQKLEIGRSEYTNTLTCVQKDNVIVEI